MSKDPYVVIARKYRPQGFDEVVGQGPVATTLRNAIELGRVGHAYIFTGPRGVGKTSVARIFAKALNCAKGPSINPCGKCPSCQEIEGSRSLDVLEIDGASNRGIDEIRALRENVKFAPSHGKYKIYIIDEVHQIPNAGFNALLKTLEEPPAHVKFIFATTAAHKVPATILSRCQRFDFRRISTDEIYKTLQNICKREKVNIDDDALFMVAKAADGSLRDGQSILDQMAASSQDKITKKEVLRSLGWLEEDKFLDLTDAIAKKDSHQALLILDAVLKDGKDPILFTQSYLEHIRNLLFLKTSDQLISLIDATESYKAGLLKEKDLFTKDDLLYFFSVLMHAMQTMKRFDAKCIPLEIALIKLTNRAPLESIEKAIETLNNLEKKNLISASSPTFLRNSAPVRVETPLSPPSLEKDIKIEETDDLEELPTEDLNLSTLQEEKKVCSLDTIWEPLIRALKNEKISVASYLAEGEPVNFENGVVRISFLETLSFHRECLEQQINKQLIEKHLSSFLDTAVRVQFESVKKLIKKPSEKNGEALSAVSQKMDPDSENLVKSAEELFGGRITRG